MKKKFLLILLLSFLFSSDKHWSTTRFESWWNSKFNSMQFREPVTFIPYHIKIGKFYYGGPKYIEDVFESGISDTLEVSPFFTDHNQAFTYVDNNIKYREGISLDIDFLSYNFFKNKQNDYDVYFGFNYKINKIIDKPFVDSNWIDNNNKNIFARPTSQAFGLNIGVIHQWNSLFFNKINYTYSIIESNLFETSGGSRLIYGNGNLRALSFGMYFIKPLESKNYDLHYGSEISFEEINLDKIDNLSAHIEKFNSQSIKLSFSFGIGYGGKKTIGDIGYSNLINNNYIEALENFEKFKIQYPEHSKLDIVNNMINFSNAKIGYQMLYNGIQSHRRGNLEEAVKWYDEATQYSDSNLKREIDMRKYLLADELYNNLSTGLSINESISKLQNIKTISIKISDKVDSKIADLLYVKGENLLYDNFYFSSYDVFQEAQSIYPKKKYVYNGKINVLISELIKDTQNYIKKNEYILAYNAMQFLDKINNESEVDLEDELLDLKTKITESRRKRILESSQKIISEYQNQFTQLDNMKYLIEGDSYNKVVSLFGSPSKLIEKEVGSDNYTMIIYEGINNEYKIYFNNNTLIDIEEVK